jgi:hypothetical protein
MASCQDNAKNSYTRRTEAAKKMRQRVQDRNHTPLEDPSLSARCARLDEASRQRAMTQIICWDAEMPEYGGDEDHGHCGGLAKSAEGHLQGDENHTHRFGERG